LDFDITNRDFHQYVSPGLRATDFDPSGPGEEAVDIWSLTYARPTHLEGIAGLAHKLWEPRLAARLVHQVGQSFIIGESAWFVISCRDKIAGFTGIRASWMMPEAAECIGINVDPEHQGLGFGRTLNQARLALAKANGSSYVLVSTVQPGFFESEGFKVIDVHKQWVVMKKEL
jgi:N-acetylglutamate synthase-like GNAT family acetyltransferase